MQRRQFLKTLGATAPAALAAERGETAKRAPAAIGRTAEPRVLMFDDGRHAAPLYQFAPPLEPADVTQVVDQLVGSGVDTLILFAGLEGGMALYDSRVVQKWGDNAVRWTHPIFYRAARHLQRLIADGHDPLKLYCDRCHEKGLWLIANNYVAITGGDRTADGGFGRKSDFVYDHPQFQVGPEDDPRSEHVDPRRFSFLHTEYRRERLLVFEELLARYETDGVELNLAEFVPLAKFSEVDRLAPLLTDWIADVRAAARAAETAQGRRKRIYVRIPAHPKAWKALGYDVPTWVKEKLVDALVCLPGLMEHPLDQDPDLAAAVELTRGQPCRVLAATGVVIGRQVENAATAEMTWAAAANAYDQGADGFGICDYLWFPNGWPWTDREYGTLRLLGHPDLLATADKRYRLRSDPRGGASAGGWLPGLTPALPQTLVEGEPLELRLRIADDLPRWHALGKVNSVRLRVRLTNIEPSLNKLRVELNGRILPDTMLELNDLTYRLRKLGPVSPYGYDYQYELGPDHYPRRGHNTLKVTIVERDPNVAFSIDVYDVDCCIGYDLHRHFRDAPIDY